MSMRLTDAQSESWLGRGGLDQSAGRTSQRIPVYLLFFSLDSLHTAIGYWIGFLRQWHVGSRYQREDKSVKLQIAVYRHNETLQRHIV